MFYFFSDLFNLKVLGKFPVYYFHKEKNVGDLLTPYIVSKLTGRVAHNSKSRRFDHLLGVGSMVHRAKKNSYIWGTGTLDKNIGSKYPVEDLNVFALRGHLSVENLFGTRAVDGDLALGDPGLLMPRFFKPKVEKEFKVGIIPHYVDLGSDCIENLPGVKILDVRSEPEGFIVQMMACEFVLSSSLHGLILADAYGIKNKWVSFSDKVTGGEFKFKDYYSTTDMVDESCVEVRSRAECLDIINRIEEFAFLKHFLESEEKLLDSFPMGCF